MPFNNIYSTSHELRAASVEAQPEPEIDDLNDPNEMEIEETTNQNEEEKENVVINRARDDHDMKKQRSNEMLANVLFPAVAPVAPVTKAAGYRPRFSEPLGSKKPHLNNRKSLSPRHASARSATAGTLLALPLAQQFATLKARNVVLEAQLKEGNSKGDGALFRATTRISSLEKNLLEKDALIEHMEKNGGATAAEQLKKLEMLAEALKKEVERVNKELEEKGKEMEEVQTEKDGWESEATRLTAELEAKPAPVNLILPPLPTTELENEITQLNLALATLALKKNEYKWANAKLRCALQTVRVSSKFETGTYDILSRKEEQETCKFEYEVATLTSKVSLNEIDKEEFAETLIANQQQIETLQNTRIALLEAHTETSTSLTLTKQELNNSKATLTAETSRATSLTKELAKTKQSLAFSVTEVKESQERVDELEAEIDRMEGEIAGVDKAEKKKSKLEMKEISNLKANITEEVEKREVVEEQVKTLKISLKAVELDLKNSKKSLAQAEKDKEAATKDKEVAQMNLEKAFTAFTVSTANAAATPIVAPHPLKKVKAVKAKVVEPIEEEEEEEQDEEADTSMIELKEAAKAKAKPKQRVKKVVTPVSPIDSDASEEDSIPKPIKKLLKVVTAPKPTVAKKPKVVKPKAVVVLGEKNVNAKEKVKEKSVVKGKKRDLVSVVEEEEDEEPVKKKKKSLFSGAKKFEWTNVVETSDNSLGLPSALSPVKISGVGRPSLNGRGLTVGRKSIFG